MQEPRLTTNRVCAFAKSYPGALALDERFPVMESRVCGVLKA